MTKEGSGAKPASLPPDDGAQGPGTGDIVLPARFGKYTLLRELATGGMAELFLALQRSVAGFEKVLVLKRILPHLARDETFIQMLLTEARIAATLNHPNIAHVYDVGVYDGNYFIAMEHIHGEDLRTVVRQMRKKDVERFPLEHALAIGVGAAAGLAYAHEKVGLDGEPMEIVHRDVSPQNIVVTFSGDVKLVDFGIAKAGRSRLEDTQAGRLKGKIPYMSPEQARGEALDGRSDLFSLAIVLYELVTGRRLFKGQNEFDSLQMITEGTIPAPRDLEPDVPEPIDDILMRALARDPETRTPTARAFQGELEAYVREAQVPVSPISLAAWMQSLFAEEIVAQEAMLQEARQVAESLGEPSPEDTASGFWGGSVSTASPPAPSPDESAHPPAPPGRAWIARLFVGFAVLAAVAALWLRPRSTPPAPTPSPKAPPAEATRADGDAMPAVLRVRSSPTGATVLLDGETTDRVTPATLTGIEPGASHRVTLSLEGYDPAVHDIVLAPGAVDDLEVTLRPFPLEPGQALLRLEVTPSDARVRFAGEPVPGEGSHREIRTRARRGRLRIDRTGYRDHEATVRLVEGAIEDVTVRLAPLASREEERPGESPEAAEATTPGRLVFDARPWCEVSLSGRDLGRTPVVEERIEPGRYRLRCRNPELGLTRETNVEIRSGETTRLRLELGP